MKFKGIRISPHPPPKSLRQNSGRLVTRGAGPPSDGPALRPLGLDWGLNPQNRRERGTAWGTHTTTVNNFQGCISRLLHKRAIQEKELTVPSWPRPRLSHARAEGHAATSPHSWRSPECSGASSLVLEHGLNSRVGGFYSLLNLGRKNSLILKTRQTPNQL